MCKKLAGLVGIGILFCGILLTGCSRYSDADYEAVATEVSMKYHVQVKVDVDGIKHDITPEQFREHLETIARGQQRKALEENLVEEAAARA